MQKLDLSVDGLYHSPHLPAGHRVHKLLEGIQEASTVSKKQARMPDYLWGPERFKLNKTKLWQKLNPDQQKETLKLLSERNLSLSWWIENSGRSYCAKMILLSETHEEKSLYSHFCHEEATHMKEFENFMDFKVDWNLHSHPMLTPLSQVIEQGDRDTLVLVVQVLLEGFGLGHYLSLKEDCLLPELSLAYERILKDEARHHGTGVAFAQEMKPSKESFDQMFLFSRAFIETFKNLKWIEDSIQRNYGSLSQLEVKTLHEELGTIETYHERCKRFKTMLLKVDDFGLVKKLEDEGVFSK